MPVTRAPVSFQRPKCVNGHEGDSIIRLNGMWVCVECLKVTNKRTGAALNVTDIYPNRAARRAARRVS